MKQKVHFWCPVCFFIIVNPFIRKVINLEINQILSVYMFTEIELLPFYLLWLLLFLGTYLFIIPIYFVFLHIFPSYFIFCIKNKIGEKKWFTSKALHACFRFLYHYLLLITVFSKHIRLYVYFIVCGTNHLLDCPMICFYDFFEVSIFSSIAAGK